MVGQLTRPNGVQKRYEKRYQRYKKYRLSGKYTIEQIAEFLDVQTGALKNPRYYERFAIETGQYKPTEEVVIRRSELPMYIRVRMEYLHERFWQLFDLLSKKYGSSIMEWDEHDVLFIEMREVAEQAQQEELAVRWR